MIANAQPNDPRDKATPGGPAGAGGDVRFTQVFSLDRPWDFEPHFADRAAWEGRARILRQQFLVAMGLWPMPPKTPLHAAIHGKIDRGDYTIEKVFFQSLPGQYVSGNLYRPKGLTGKAPAVLCPHGHWVNGRLTWASDERVKSDLACGAERWEAGSRAANQARCAGLARLGCIAFIYDMVGYGESTKLVHRTGFNDAEAVGRLQSMMGLQTWNSIRALDFLCTLSDVDSTRLAITGESGGGTQTIALSVVDSRLSAAFPAVMVSMNMQGGCACENAPLARVQTNNIELIALLAPKPLAMSSALDWTRDLQTRGLPQLRSIYHLYDADRQVAARLFPYQHGFNQPSREMMYNFMNDALKVGAKAPIAEKPFVAEAPENLRVYDAAHPLPADATDVKGVRGWMSDASSRELAALAARDPAAYRDLLRVALRSMVVDDLPEPSDVEAHGDAGAELPLAAGGAWSGYISRKGSGEHIAMRVVFPRRWNGRIIIWSDAKGTSRLKNAGAAAAGNLTAAIDPAVKELLDAHAAVVAIDLFMAGEFHPRPESPSAEAPAKKGADPSASYIGMTLGYNRSVMANRVHDLLSAIAVARGWREAKSIDLIATGDAGPSALLARALAGAAVDRAAIDLNQFDFEQVHDLGDPMLLPGALKYGGIPAFSTLCDRGETLLHNARGPMPKDVTGMTSQATRRDDASCARWLAR